MPKFKGDGGDNTLTGSLGADILIGLGGNDTYIANDLGDQIVEKAGQGTDLIETSMLDDNGTYSLGWWTNVENLRYTGTEAAQLVGDAGNNLIEANAALNRNDTLSGGIGDDVLRGWRGRDLLIGGIGNDLLDGGQGDDTMIGGSGDDSYVIDSAGDRITEFSGGGIDTILSDVLLDLGFGWTTAVEHLTYTGSGGADLHGNTLSNRIMSQSADADRLFGGEGDDTLDGGGGADHLEGGDGNDTYLADATDVIVEFAGGGIDRVLGLVTDIGIGALAEVIENLTYTGADDVAVNGNDLGNDIAGGDGRNTVNGRGAGDRLFGGRGADNLFGGAGDDTLAGGLLQGGDFATAPVDDGARDTLQGGDGNDRYLITDSRDSVIEFAGQGNRDVLWAHVDASLRDAAEVEALVLATDGGAWLAQGGTGGDILVGNQNDNFIQGRGGNDTLSGWGGIPGFGEDVLDGGGGNDVLVAFDFLPSFGGGTVAMLGGDGDDLYVIGTSAAVAGFDSGGSDTAYVVANTSLLGMEGIEQIFLASDFAAPFLQAFDAAAAVAAASGMLFFGFGPASDVTGTDGSNQIEGNDLANAMDGAGGADTIRGKFGSDTLTGGNGGDALFGDGDADTLYGGQDGDTLAGGAGDDLMVGGAGNDVLAADAGVQSGAFYLRTGDVMWGDNPFDPFATGADEFRFTDVTGSNGAIETFVGSGLFYFNCGATVGDFQSGVDTLRLAAFMVGDNDTLLENAQVVAGPGLFSASAELVIFRTDAEDVTFGSVFDAGAVAAAIGSATGVFAAGSERIFVMDDGTNSAIFVFMSNNGDASVTFDELYFLASVSDVTSLAVSDFSLF